MWQSYQYEKQRESNYGVILNNLGVPRMCCRRMFLTHVNVVDDILQYSQMDEVVDESGTIFLCEVNMTREISCD